MEVQETLVRTGHGPAHIRAPRGAFYAPFWLAVSEAAKRSKEGQLEPPLLSATWGSSRTIWRGIWDSEWVTGACLEKVECEQKLRKWGLPGGPVVKNLPCNAEDVGSIPGWRTKILHATVQLTPGTTTAEPRSRNQRIHRPQQKILRATTKTPHSQKNK